VNAIEAMVATAERDGSIALPFLTQADLCALGTAHKSLICARTWSWWMELDDGQRTDLCLKSLEILTLRELITPATSAIPAVPVPELGLILAARAQPGLVVTCQIPGQDAGFEPRFFGVTQQGAGLRALVRETLTADASGPDGRADFGTILRYTLMASFDAADAMTTWARGKGTATALDMFGHDANGRLFRDRFEIGPCGDLFDVYRPAGGIPPGRLDHMDLRQLLAESLIGAAR
jgi:hypothetical protein